MKPSEALERHRADIRRVVEGNHAQNPRVFGSVLRGEDTEASDLDLLVDPTPQTTLFDIARIGMRLEELLGLTVDVVTPKGLHPRMRDRVLAEAAPV
jgi:predicted nucleotidyltransferase